LLRLLYIHVTGEGNFVSVAEKSKTLLYYIWNSTVVSQTGGSWWRTKSAQYFLQHVTAFSTFIWSTQEYTKKDAVRVCLDSRGVFDNISGNLAYKSNRYWHVTTKTLIGDSGETSGVYTIYCLGDRGYVIIPNNGYSTAAIKSNQYLLTCNK